LIEPGRTEAVRRIKDLSAAAVFIAATGALATGTIVLLPKLLALATLRPTAQP
jgi:diacylglycerol kinase